MFIIRRRETQDCRELNQSLSAGFNLITPPPGVPYNVRRRAETPEKERQKSKRVRMYTAAMDGQWHLTTAHLARWLSVYGSVVFFLFFLLSVICDL